MAGQGPAPKDPAQRRRRNEPTRGEWTELPPLEHPMLPTLPKRPGRGGWAARTRTAWAAWRQDPATGMFGPAEIAAAIDLAYLHHEWARGESRLAAEIRLRMDGLGLTPKGKRDLRWRVQPPAVVIKLDDERQQKAPTRRRLRAVDPAAAGA